MKTLVIISGSPGTGKTTVARLLRGIMGGLVISLTDFVIEHDLYEEWDEERNTRIIDEERVRKALLEKINHILEKKKDEWIFVEGGFSDIIGDVASCAIVLRLHPDILRKRLENRQYTKTKIKENIQSEILGVCSGHMKDILGPSFHDVDTTGKDAREISQICRNIIEGNVEPEKYRPGLIDWIKSPDINLIDEFKKE